MRNVALWRLLNQSMHALKHVYLLVNKNTILSNGSFSQLFNNTGRNNSIGLMAQNCLKWSSGNRICGSKLPTKLVFLRHTAVHCAPYVILILRGNLQSDCPVQLISDCRISAV